MLRHGLERGPAHAAVVAGIDVCTPDLVRRRREEPAVGRFERVQHRVTGQMRPVDPPAFARSVPGYPEQPFRRADEQHQRIGAAVPAGHVSSSRGISSARLQGRVRISSWALSNSSQAVAQAPVDPGTQKTYVPLATPASARDCIVEVLICPYEIARKVSPKPSIVLSSSGLTASGVPSRPVTPVPPVVMTTSTSVSAIQPATTARIV